MGLSTGGNTLFGTEEKYLNAKVRCVDVGPHDYWYAAGEIYAVTDGVLTAKYGTLLFAPQPVESIEELNSRLSAQFELVEDDLYDGPQQPTMPPMPKTIPPDKYKHKSDKGKPELSLVPPAIIEAVGEVRTYGVKKYGDNECWKLVEPKRYKDALVRHLCEYMRDDKAVDSESGIEHLKHIACNVAFLLELMREENNGKN